MARCRYHGYLKDWLPKTDSQIVFIDDSSGEMADFITFKATEDEVLVSFYHCKKAHGVGARVEDAYEVCGQVLKSIIWVNNNEIFDQIVRRQRTTKNSTFLKGEKTELRQLLNKAKTTPTLFEIIIVQPGFTQSSLPEGIGHILAGANDYIIRGLCNPLKIMCRN